MKRCFLVCVIFAGLVAGAFAFPFANYGNIRVPDAYVMPHTMAQVTFMNYFHQESNAPGMDDFAYTWGAAVNAGLFNYGEIGLVFSGEEIFYGHLKLRLFRETVELPDITLGVDNLFSEVPTKPSSGDYPDVLDVHNYRSNTVYVAVSKTTILGGIPVVGDLPTRITVGAGTHRFRGTRDFGKTASGIFAAGQFEVISNLALIAELDGHNFNSALEYRYRNLSGKLIFYRIEEVQREGKGAKVGFSLSYIFDKYVDEELRGGFSPFRQVGAQLIDARDSASLDELQRIRRQRERAEQELQEIRRLLEE